MANATWRRSLADAEAMPPRAGDAFAEPTAARTTGHDPACRCHGTGTVVAHIALADATISDQRPCPGGRPRALDTATGRVGEVMPNPIPAALCGSQPPRIVHLRPVGGGVEWTTTPDCLQPVSEDRP